MRANSITGVAWTGMAGLVLAVGISLAWSPAAGQNGGPGGQPRPEFDKLGDQMPAGAIGCFGTARFHHGGRIQCLAYSPDGKTLAAGGGTDFVRLWEAQTGKLLKTLPLMWVQAVAFSKDGTRLAAVSAGKAVHIFDTNTGATVYTLQGHTAPVKAVTFALDDALLITAGQDKNIRIWDYKNNSERNQLRGHEDEITCLALAPDGFTLISGSSDYTLRWWNLRTGQLLHTKEAGAAVTALAMDVQGKVVASAGDNGQIRLWDVAGAKEVKSWKGHEEVVHCLRFMKDGKTLISGGADNLIALWDLANGEKKQKIATLPGDAETVALSADEDVLAYGGQNHTVRRWSLAKNKELTLAEGPQGAVVALAVSPDEKYVAYGDSTDSVCLLDAGTHKELQRWKISGTKELVLAFAPDGKRLAAATGAANVQLWDVASGKEHKLLTGPESDQVRCLAFSPVDNTLAVGYRHAGIRFFDSDSGTLQRSTAHEGGIYSLVFASNGKLVAGAGLDRVIVWKIGGEKLYQLADKQRAASLAFSPDGRTLATGQYDSMIYLWDMTNGQKVGTLEGHGSAIYSLAFSATGRRLLSGSYDKTVRIWETFSSGQITSWTGQTGPVHGVAFSPDGRRAYSASADTTILVWDVTKRSPGGKLNVEKLTQVQLESLWNELAANEPHIGHNAVWQLVSGGDEVIEFLHKRVYLVDRNELEKLIGDLDSEKYLVRTKATKLLEGYGQWIKGRLEEVSKNPASLEQKLRLDMLLEKLKGDKGFTLEQERYRLKRTMEILEQVNSARARELLVNLTKGAAENAIQEEAVQSLKRAEKKKS